MASIKIERPEIDDHRRMYTYFDEQLRDINWRAPSPTVGQSVDDYVRETCRTLKRKYLPQNHELYKPNYRGMPVDALYTFVPQLINAVKTEAVNPKNFEPGEIRMFVKTDPNSGLRFNEFYGQEFFVKQMMRPGRSVAQFITDHGRYNVAKARYE